MVGFAEKREFSGLKFSFSDGKKPIGEKIGENRSKSEKICSQPVIILAAPRTIW